MAEHVTDSGLIADLRGGIDPRRVWSAPADVAPYQRDAWPLAARWNTEQLSGHLPAAVAQVTSVEEVRTVLRVAAEHGRSVTPVGHRSAVTGAAIPARGAVVLDVLKMNRVLGFAPRDGTVTVEAGVNGGRLEEWLNQRGFTLGHYPQSLGISTVGGWISTRSSGTFSTKYGGIEQLLAGLQVVLSDGSIFDFSATPRRAVGPELMQLFCGSEGTLGVITQATLRVARLPQARLIVGWSVPDLSAAFDAIERAVDQHVLPAMARLYDANEAGSLYTLVDSSEQKPLILLGHEGHKDMVQAEAHVWAGLLREAGGTELGAEIGQAWDTARYHARWLREGNARPSQIADAIEMSVPWSEALPLYRSILKALAPMVDSVMAHWSHFYVDGCALYVIFVVLNDDPDDLQRAYADVWRSVMGAAATHRASMSHHHGVGLVRRPLLDDGVGYAAGLAGRIKRSLDPTQTLNPGKLATPATLEPRP